MTANSNPWWSSSTPNLVVHTNIPVLITTNVSGATNNINITITNTIDSYKAVYSTFQIFYTSAGTNSTTLTIYKTIDGVNLVPYATNSLVTASTNIEFQLTGKWTQIWFVSKFQATNATEQINYIGQ
jgi:hypothetical protein